MYMIFSRFASSNLITRGKYGTLYKGKKFGQDITVKKISRIAIPSSNTKPRNVESYLKELAKFYAYPAKNIIKLLAISYDIDNDQDLCLIYEHMSKGSVQDRLQLKNSSPPLTW